MPPARASAAVDAPRASGAVLVVGAGVAGLSAALELAELGCRVVLTDASPAIGGLLARLDRQFPSDHCGMCRLLPDIGREEAAQLCLRKGLFHERIEVLPATRVEAVHGEPGAFAVQLVGEPRFVDPARCTGCGDRCAEVCPVEVPDDFSGWPAARRKAIHRPVPHALPNVHRIIAEFCTRCGQCAAICPAGAIDLQAAPVQRTVRAEAIVLAAGLGLFDPAADPAMERFLVSPNVVTALQLERLLGGRGRRPGPLRRPSDGRPVRRVAWLQCVGSRAAKQGRDHCSSVCCMFALKEAVLARQQCGPELEATIFAMDLRTYGKGHHRYRVRAEQEHGVRIVRCRPHEVVALADGSLRVRFADPATGELGQQTFDLVVLSTGQAAPRPDAALAALLGAGEPTGAGTGEPQVEQLAPAPPPLVPGVASPRPGIFVCGSCHGLSDIAEAVAGGSAAAGRAARWLAALGWKVPAPAPAVAAAQPAGGQGELRVDVLLCRHPTAPGTAEGAGAGPAAAPAEGEPPLEQLRRDLAAQPGAGTVRLVELPRDAAGWQELEALLRLSRSERVLFGACPQHVHDRQLLGLARRAGVDPLLVRVVALEDAPAVQRGLPDEGARTRRALLRLRAALADLRRAELPPVEPRPVEQRALVVGGGVTGMHAALSLAERGIAVVLVERAEGLGGRALCQRLRTLDGQDGAALAAAAIDAVARQRQITVHCGAQVVESSGFPGNFRTVIHTAGGGRLPVAHGVTILATGGTEAVTTLYGRGAHDAVLTQPELAARLADGSLARGGPRTVVMIQCVGSRQPDGLDYCSRVCCHQALASALALRRADPAGRVLILAREVMAYGPWEQYYGEARRQGVLFARHAADDPPQLRFVAGRPLVRFADELLRRPVELAADLLVLSTGVRPDDSAGELARLFRLELTPDGFFAEAEPKWRPVDSARDGMFLAGTAHSPMLLGEALVQAEAAAQRAFAWLCRPQRLPARDGARVRHARCARCEVCLPVCPYGARTLDGRARQILVDALACRACGLCAAACPNGATEVPGHGGRQILAMLDALLADAGPRHAREEGGQR